SLMVRYWGNETGNRTFDLLIDNDTVTGVNISNKWKMTSFVNVIPDTCPDAGGQGQRTGDFRRTFGQRGRWCVLPEAAKWFQIDYC
ncbi:MAG: hypothetical protein PHO37_18995, partial [Kiritimatiellae bacterium]|nr:hypothetical protein [Kiritimatiellia bacterium]